MLLSYVVCESTERGL